MKNMMKIMKFTLMKSDQEHILTRQFCNRYNPNEQSKRKKKTVGIVDKTTVSFKKNKKKFFSEENAVN